MTDLKELKIIRKKVIIKTICIFISTTILIFIPSILNNQSKNLIEIIFLLIIAVIIFIPINYLINKKDTNNFRIIYKREIIKSSFKQLSSSVIYNTSSGIRKTQLGDANLILSIDKFSSSEYVKAKYKNKQFKFANIIIKNEIVDDYEETKYKELFNGQWLIMNFNKQFKNDILIFPKNLVNAKKINNLENKNYKLIENQKLSNKYLVYLKGSKINNLKVIEEKVDKISKELKTTIILIISNNELQLGLNSKRYIFKPNIYKRINPSTDKLKIIEELIKLSSFIDTMEKQKDIFSKNKTLK